MNDDLMSFVTRAFKAAGISDFEITSEEDNHLSIDKWIDIVGYKNPDDLSSDNQPMIWEVYEAVMIPGSYWQPEDVDIVELYRGLSWYEAVKVAIIRMVDCRVSGFLQAEAEYAAYREESE